MNLLRMRNSFDMNLTDTGSTLAAMKQVSMMDVVAPTLGSGMLVLFDQEEKSCQPT